MRHPFATFLIAASVMLTVSSSALADDLFEVTASTDDALPNQFTVEASGNSLLDLTQDVIESRNEFKNFKNRGVSGSLNFGGVEDAIQVSVNQSSTEATLRLDLIDFEKTFTGANRDELEDEIEDFLTKDGANIYGRFLREIREQTLIAVLDGNPESSTALVSHQMFKEYAFAQRNPQWLQGGTGSSAGLGPTGRRWANNSDQAAEAAAQAEASGSGSSNPDTRWFNLSGGASKVSADQFDGYRGNVDFTSGQWFNEHIGLGFSAQAAYRELEGASIYHGSGQLALPIRFLNAEPLGKGGEVTLDWQVTPFGHGTIAGSVDIGDGGVMGGGGAANRLTFDFAAVQVTVGNQINFFEGIPLEYGDEFEYDTDVSQQLLSNGILATVPFGEVFFVNGGVVHNQYLGDAAVETWFSPSASVGVVTDGNDVFVVSYEGKLGKEDFSSHGVNLSATFRF